MSGEYVAALIRRRHVFYVEGYDPQGASGYHRLFAREWQRFRQVWPLDGTLGELEIASDDFAHWTVETNGPNWRTVTRYEFLRLEKIIAANMADPLPWQVFRALRWMFGDIVSGVLPRIFRASWQFGLHLIWPQIMLLMWPAVAIGGGWFAAEMASRHLALPAAAGFLLGVAVAIAVFFGLRPLADRWRIIQVVNGWPYLREFARNVPTEFDRPVELLAQRIVNAARAKEADEILIVNHSAGGVYGPVAMARALEIDPQLGRYGPRIVLMTVGSLMPAFALHPAAGRLRSAIRHMATARDVLWVDCQARTDVMNFFDFDPVGGVGVDAGSERCNPVIWSVRFRDVIAPEVFHRLRWKFFRIHFQFIMASYRRAAYDYFMVVCGPAPVAVWASPNILGRFTEDARYEPFAWPPASVMAEAAPRGVA